MPRLDLATRLLLVVHHRELKRTTNSGRLATLALTNSRLMIRGAGSERLDLTPLLDPDYHSVVLYPAEDARDLSELTFDKPVQLIVADGTWRQAGKVHRRHPELVGLPRVKLTAVNSGTQHLRKEHFAEGFSTLEAIARAYGVLEGPAVERQLIDLYRAKLRATVEGRGQTYEGPTESL